MATVIVTIGGCSDPNARSAALVSLIRDLGITFLDIEIRWNGTPTKDGGTTAAVLRDWREGYANVIKWALGRALPDSKIEIIQPTAE